MKRFAVLLCVGLAVLAALTATLAARPETTRPAITGIAYVHIYTTNLDEASKFYKMVLAAAPALPSLDPKAAPITIEPLPKNNDGTDLLKEVAFFTADAEGLRKYLASKGLTPEKMTKCAGEHCFAIQDPENHRLVFVQQSNAKTPDANWTPIIHAGFIVKDRASMDKFYKDVLDYRVYWHGGMKDDETSWVDMQVPEGADWVEYMLGAGPNPNAHTRGVLNHIALGVPDIHVAQQKLLQAGWKPGEEPKIGRDGKWQLNLYDPDFTRVEFMEYTPAEKPCCAPITGPNPGPPPASPIHNGGAE